MNKLVEKYFSDTCSDYGSIPLRGAAQKQLFLRFKNIKQINQLKNAFQMQIQITEAATKSCCSIAVPKI